MAIAALTRNLLRNASAVFSSSNKIGLLLIDVLLSLFFLVVKDANFVLGDFDIFLLNIKLLYTYQL